MKTHTTLSGSRSLPLSRSLSLLVLAALAPACGPNDATDGDGGGDSMAVEARGAELLSGVPIQPLPSATLLRPAITSISPTSGAPGTTVTILGRGFDVLIVGPAAFGSPSLTAARASLQYVSSGELRAVVPAGAAPGPIYILSNFGLAGRPMPVQLTSAQTFTPLVSPTAPSGLTARVVSDSEIDLSWVDNSWNETAFDIWMQDNAGWRSLGTVAANHTSEPITGLASGQTVSFKLRAQNATGSSAFSNVVTATTFHTFVDVTVTSSTSLSPLRPAGAQTLFHSNTASAFLDASPADGLLAGFAAGGPFPRWPQPMNGSPPVSIVREGNQFAIDSAGTRANLALVAQIPGTGGSNGGPQYVVLHLAVTTNAQGNITAVAPIFGSGGDDSVGVAGRIMTAFSLSITIAGSINGRVSGSADMSLFLDEPFATPSGLAFDHHESTLHLAYDLPVTPK